MNKVLKSAAVFIMSAVLIAVTAVSAFAFSANTGDSVELIVSIEGEDSMGSTNIQISYDKDKLDLLSDETLTGTGVSNTTEAGTIIWANMFDLDGADFSKKTDVYKVIFIAKQDISDVEPLISFSVNDAYKIDESGVTAADKSHLSYSVALEGSGTSVGSSESSNNNNNNDNNNNNNNNNNADNSTAAQSSSKTVSSKSESSGSSSGSVSSAASSKAAENSSKVVSNDTAADKDENTDTASESAVSIAESYDQAEFESVPPIKLDEEVSTADSRGSFPKGAIVGIVVCLMIAAAGVAVIMAKRKG